MTPTQVEQIKTVFAQAMDHGDDMRVQLDQLRVDVPPAKVGPIERAVTLSRDAGAVVQAGHYRPKPLSRHRVYVISAFGSGTQAMPLLWELLHLPVKEG